MIWGWESSRRHRKTEQRTLEDLGPALPSVEEAALEHPHFPLNCSAVTGGSNGAGKGITLEGLQRKLMSLKFWSIKVTLHSATEAMGQWKHIAVCSPNSKIKTQEATECCRHWPWLYHLANLCCLWGCTAVSEKTNLMISRGVSVYFSPLFLERGGRNNKPKTLLHNQNAESIYVLY